MTQPNTDNPSDPQPPNPFTHTQEQLNAAAAAARRDEAAKYADYDDLKARAAKATELENQQLSETERLRNALAEAQGSQARTEGRIADAMISAAVQVKASALGCVDPEAALALVDRTRISYTQADGVQGVDEALTTLLEAKPYLKGSPTLTPTAPDLNAGPGKPGNAPVPLTEAELDMARRMRMTPEQYAIGRTQTEPIPPTPGR